MAELASYLDHTLLAPDAWIEDIERICAEAVEIRCAAVCVNGVHVLRAARCLTGTEIATAAVVGFPLGAMHPDVKEREAVLALEDGARELDVVIQIGALRSGDEAFVASELTRIARRAHESNALLKAIVETALLDEEEKIMACRVAVDAGADFLKTSTGFARAGVMVEDVALLRRVAGVGVGVKAAGGIRTAEDAQRMIDAGATRIGTSSALAIASASP